MNRAEIVAVTQPLVEIERDDYGRQMTAEEFLSYVARVSNPSNQMNTATAQKLLRYCMRNNHWSVFEMVNVVMKITTTRDIGRQMLRHRSFSFQEFSQRYADPTKELGFVTREARLQDHKNRQNSIKVNDSGLQKQWELWQRQVQIVANEAYNWAIDVGIAKEQARVVLPEGMMQTSMFMNGTLRSWIHYCGLRRKNGTQLEHTQVAESAWQEILHYFESLKEEEQAA